MAQQNLIAPTGNTFLDALGQVSGIVTGTANQILETGGTFLDRLTAYKVARSQAKADPVYIPSPVSNATDSTKVKNIALSIGVIGSVALIGWMVFKK